MNGAAPHASGPRPVPPVGLYVHVPFCVSICPYCDFVVHAGAPRPVSEPLVDAFVAALRDLGAEVATGVFGAHMQVSLVNDGPVTILVDTKIRE